ncbi:MAG: 30S ribosomal protein S18 [Candidatus Shapirobacteria bacterium]|jgi:small subunit ribosomal protein S18
MATKRSIKETNLARKRALAKSKVCYFCAEKTTPSWTDYEKLGEYLSGRARIIGKNYSGVCAKHQRQIARSIKQARHLGLMPFTTRA